MKQQINKSYQKVPLIATIVSIFLTLIKFIAGILSGSVLLLSSAIDSILDVGMSIFNYFVLKLSSKPVDIQFNYGKGKVEGIATVIEGTIIILSGVYIIYESIKKLIYKETITHLDLGIYVIIFSIILVGFLVWYLSYMAKKSGNIVIKNDLLHYKIDLFTNIIVIFSLIIVHFTGFDFVDFWLGLFAGIYIIFESFKLMKKGIGILLDKALEERKKITKILDNFVKKNIIHSWHDLKTRKGGIFKFVEFHFVVDPNTTIKTAHDVIDNIKKKIEKLDKKSVWEIIVHADWKDDSKFKELKKT